MPVGDAPEERNGAWYWLARGSGVWWNSGTTILAWQGEVLDEQEKALRIILKVEGGLVTGAAGTGKIRDHQEIPNRALRMQRDGLCLCLYTCCNQTRGWMDN